MRIVKVSPAPPEPHLVYPCSGCQSGHHALNCATQNIVDLWLAMRAETKRADEAEADVQRTIDEYYEATMAVHAEVDARAREEAARKIEEYHSTECPRRYNAHDCGCLALAALVRGR